LILLIDGSVKRLYIGTAFLPLFQKKKKVKKMGSALYNSLIVARPGLDGEIHTLGLLAELMPSLDSVAANLNLTDGSVGLPLLSDMLLGIKIRICC
jgi:hypothetical protein